jgi:hypothetical protein
MNFTLEELKETIELFSVNQCSFLTENCIVALEASKHQTGCKLEIIGDQIDNAQLNWKTVVNKAGYKEPKKYVEHGATAIAFFLARSYTDFNVLEEAIIGTGFDYWLGYDSKHSKYNPLNFMAARLEISGILKETIHNSINERVKIKKAQTNSSNSLKLPAYVSVVEFSKPKAYFAKK